MHQAVARSARASVLALALVVIAPAAVAGEAAASDRPGGASYAPGGAGTEVAIRALSLVGVDYRLGGNDRREGLDCSGLVGLVFDEALGLPLPRTSAELAGVGLRVDRRLLEPGDLVFFNTRRRAYSHVGIYVGAGRFVHAPASGRKVRIEALAGRYWSSRFDGARRVGRRAAPTVRGADADPSAAAWRPDPRPASPPERAPDGGDMRFWSAY